MSILTIKYLSSFPVSEYEDTFNLPEAVMIEYDPDLVKTPESWGHVFDTNKTQRVIQNIGYEQYEIEEIYAKNINLNSLASANHVLVETDTGDEFYATDIEVEQNDTASRDSSFKVRFKKQVVFKYELSSDFAEEFPAEYTFEADTILATNGEITERNNATLTANISVGDYLDFEVADPDFADENKTKLYVYQYNAGPDEYEFRFFPFGNLTKSYTTTIKALGFGNHLVNSLEYTVKNPSYAFNNITTYLDSLYMYFKVPFNDLVDSIEVGDDYYLHSNNTTFNSVVDDTGDYLNFATCTAKDADYVTFKCSYDTMTATTVYTINNIIIDHEPKTPAIPSGVTVADKEIDFTIYTFINPIYSNIDEDEDDITKDDLTKYKGRTDSYMQAYLKCWLTTDELYKAKYLRYAQEVTLTLASGLVITPISKTDIIAEEPKESLSELYEFNLKLRYEHQVINNNREIIF